MRQAYLDLVRRHFEGTAAAWSSRVPPRPDAEVPSFRNHRGDPAAV